MSFSHSNLIFLIILPPPKILPLVSKLSHIGHNLKAFHILQQLNQDNNHKTRKVPIRRPDKEIRKELQEQEVPVRSLQQGRQANSQLPKIWRNYYQSRSTILEFSNTLFRQRHIRRYFCKKIIEMCTGECWKVRDIFREFKKMLHILRSYMKLRK